MGVAAASTAAGAAIYLCAFRRPVLTWGATAEEATARLPGDELLEHADGSSTRAIDIDAPASAVWPWIAQMGPSPRGGAYTYDWIENLLGLDFHSVDEILPEFQDPRVGEKIGFGSNTMRLERAEPPHALVWRSEDGNWTWSFVLHGVGSHTRLISRNRFRLPSLPARIAMLPLEPGSLLMERRMLLGIRERAQRLARHAELLADPAPVVAAARAASNGGSGDAGFSAGQWDAASPGHRPRVAVCFATVHGSTRGIAERIAARLRDGRCEAEAIPVEQVREPDGFDAFVVGSPVFNQCWMSELEDFLARNEQILAARQTWLFSVGSFGDSSRVFGSLVRREPRDIELWERAIHPRGYRVFAGVIDRKLWPLPARLFFHLFGGRFGDKRDWPQVDRWAGSIAEELSRSPRLRARLASA